MSTKFMTAVTLNADQAYEVLSKRTDGKLCVKQTIAAIFTNETGYDLNYETQMQSGKVEVTGGVIPAGFSAVVQPQGELHVLSKGEGEDMVSTAAKLYDLDNPMKPQEAFEEAALRGLSLTQTDQVINATRMLTLAGSDQTPDPRDVPWTYAQAKGQVIPFRCGLQFILPKPSWGEGAQQVGELDTAFVVNVLTDEVYLIGRDELVKNWLIKEDPSLDAKAFWSALPVIGNDDFDAMMA